MNGGPIEAATVGLLLAGGTPQRRRRRGDQRTATGGGCVAKPGAGGAFAFGTGPGLAL